MMARPILTLAAALLLAAPAPAFATGGQAEIDLGDEFDIDLEEPAKPAPKPGPWKLATTREGLIAQEAELETELEAIAKVLTAAEQRKWLWPRFKGAERAADHEIRDAERLSRLLDAGVQSGEWTSEQASNVRNRHMEENASAVSRLRVRQVNFTRRLEQVQAALKTK